MKSWEKIPKAPTDEEAKRHNQNLPGMGGVFNTVNASLYHYAGNNPVKYTDPTGKWTDNEDGTFTAEAGDTLWRLYGSGWQERSDYTGDPTKLQVGDIVGKKRENHDVWNSVRTTNNDVINEEPNSKAYYQSMFGAGITLVGGGNFEVGFVWDTLGNKGIAISGDLGCGVSADINIKGLKAFGNLLLSNIISDFQSYTCINGTIYDFEGTYATAKVHVLGGVTTDLNNPNNSNFSIELSVGGGTFWGGTKVFGSSSMRCAMEFNNFCKINMKISMITELLLLSVLLLLNRWVGNECFNFYIFSSVLCKVIGYGTIVSYPLIKLKSKIYEMEITGEKFEIMYAICILILFFVQILLIGRISSFKRIYKKRHSQ